MIEPNSSNWRATFSGVIGSSSSRGASAAMTMRGILNTLTRSSASSWLGIGSGCGGCQGVRVRQPRGPWRSRPGSIPGSPLRCPWRPGLNGKPRSRSRPRGPIRGQFEANGSSGVLWKLTWEPQGNQPALPLGFLSGAPRGKRRPRKALRGWPCFATFKCQMLKRGPYGFSAIGRRSLNINKSHRIPLDHGKLIVVTSPRHFHTIVKIGLSNWLKILPFARTNPKFGIIAPPRFTV